ncbi:MAG TPA: hypothetical protein VF214_04240 [Edaphobacter sp.]
MGTTMGIIDGQLEEQSFLSSLFDRFADVNKLFRIALWVFVINTVFVPLLMQFIVPSLSVSGFVRFDGFFDSVGRLAPFTFLFSALAVLALGIAKIFQARKE